MNARSYKIILGILSFCILFILLVQAYWIRNSYLRKKDDFNRVVYESLNQLSEKLYERKNLNQFKTYFIQNGDTLASTPSHHIKIETESRVSVISERDQKVVVENIRGPKERRTVDSLFLGGGNKNINILLNGKKATIKIPSPPKGSRTYQVKTNMQKDSAGDALSKLVNKMVTEITGMDVEDENPDSLKKLIKRTLENKGLFIPFEFSKQKQEGLKTQVLSHSAGYNEKLPAYKTDLSANKIFNTHEFLLLQFPSQNNFIMAGIKSSLILSFVFSLVIISAFYYTLRLILKQKKISEIRNDFVNNMTHELKTPIATISLALDAIKNPYIKNDEEKFTEYNRILKEENQKLNKHVERVLQMALLEKGELPLYKKQINLVNLLNQVIADYKLQIEEQHATVEFLPSSENVVMTADEQHLQTVFSNLLDNALKYAHSECRILIQLQADANGIKITFKDNGIGIDKEHRDKIFDKFYRAQGGNLHEVKGFGLGLSYVKSIVEAHGGTIELHSEKGKGTEFVLFFKTI